MINLTTFFFNKDRNPIPEDVSLFSEDLRESAKAVIRYLNSFDLDKFNLAFVSELILRFFHDPNSKYDTDFIVSIITHQIGNINSIQFPEHKIWLEARCKEIYRILLSTLSSILDILVSPFYHFPIPPCSICKKRYANYSVSIEKHITDSLNWQTSGDFIVGRFCHNIVFYDINNTITSDRLSYRSEFLLYPPESLDLIKKNDRYNVRVPIIGIIPISEDDPLYSELLKTDELTRFGHHTSLFDRARFLINPDNYRYSTDSMFLTFSNFPSLQTPLYLRKLSEVKYIYICPYCHSLFREIDSDSCPNCHNKIVPELYLSD